MTVVSTTASDHCGILLGPAVVVTGEAQNMALRVHLHMLTLLLQALTVVSQNVSSSKQDIVIALLGVASPSPFNYFSLNSLASAVPLAITDAYSAPGFLPNYTLRYVLQSSECNSKVCPIYIKVMYKSYFLIKNIT